MSNVTITLDGAAAVIAQVELAELARWHRGRALLLAALRGTDAPTEAETTSDIWGRKLAEVAAAMERELYPRDPSVPEHEYRPAAGTIGRDDGGPCWFDSCGLGQDDPIHWDRRVCRCADPVCPKVHPVDMAVPA